VLFFEGEYDLEPEEEEQEELSSTSDYSDILNYFKFKLFL